MILLLYSLLKRSLLLLSILVSFTCSWLAGAQAPAISSSNQNTPAPVLPHTPQPTPQYNRQNFYPFAGVFCGSGATTSAVTTRPTFGCGVGFTFIPLPIYTEVGIMGPQANRSYLSGYVSTDVNIPLAPVTSTYVPVALVGYSRLFETGHALDYGLALILPRPGTKTDPSASNLRVELRDYWTFANPNQHNVMLRLGLVSFETD